MLLIPPYHFVCEFRCSFFFYISKTREHTWANFAQRCDDAFLSNLLLNFSVCFSSRRPCFWILLHFIFCKRCLANMHRCGNQKSFCCHVFHISRRCGIFYLQSMVIFNTAEDLTSIPHDGHDGSTGARTLGQITPDPRCEEHLPCPRIDPKVYFTLFRHNILGYMINKNIDRSRYILSSGEDKPKGFTVIILFWKFPASHPVQTSGPDARWANEGGGNSRARTMVIPMNDHTYWDHIPT